MTLNWIYISKMYDGQNELVSGLHKELFPNSISEFGILNLI